MAGLKSGGMLHAAVQTFEKAKEKEQEAVARRNPGRMFMSSSPANASTQQPPARPNGSQNSMRPLSASAVNSRNPPFIPHGVKRMSNGLAKALDNSFEDEKPVIKQGQMKPSDVIVIDENDFDSDLDLDVEEAKTFSSVARASFRPIVYPTVPMRQEMHSTYMHDPDEFDSSIPFNWSSSPPQHHLAGGLPLNHTPLKGKGVPLVKTEHGVNHAAIGRSIIANRNPEPAALIEEQVSFKKASTLQPPPQKRTLPWKKAVKLEDTAYNEDAQASMTPMPNEKKTGLAFLNGTASTIKEQQKQHRADARPLPKKLDGRLSPKKNEASDKSRAAISSRNKKVPKVFLSEEQQHVLNMVVKQRQSTFFTGSAGTGKSVLLREIIAEFRREYKKEPDRVAVTASTGLAACNVGGTTLHSFAGIGLGKEEVPELVKKIKRNQKAKQRWLRTKVLIVDEVSMVDAELFDKLENIARTIRNNGRPFGGIQLVITGDFFQLPPVPEKGGKVARFCFDANQWTTTIANTIGLHHVFRQKDPVFAGMLNEMREGRLTQSSINAFKSLDRKIGNGIDELEATALFPLRKEVDIANYTRLQALQGDEFVYEAKDGGTIQDKVQRDKILQNCIAPETITLKKGAQVMLIKNIDEDLVNGSIGRVVAFMEEKEFDKMKLDDEIFARINAEAEALQYKEGGMSKEENVSKEEKARKRLMDNITTSRRYPMVRFMLQDGTSRDMLCQHENWKVELPNGEVQASRTQVPLILSWALSIHKAQGQTLDRVIVDLGKVFEKGQAYVALSRATSMAGLQVKNFKPTSVMAHERVRTFYANLAKIELTGGKAVATA